MPNVIVSRQEVASIDSGENGMTLNRQFKPLSGSPGIDFHQVVHICCVIVSEPDWPFSITGELDDTYFSVDDWGDLSPAGALVQPRSRFDIAIGRFQPAGRFRTVGISGRVRRSGIGAGVDISLATLAAGSDTIRPGGVRGCAWLSGIIPLYQLFRILGNWFHYILSGSGGMADFSDQSGILSGSANLSARRKI